jgi:hypothetical protein
MGDHARLAFLAGLQHQSRAAGGRAEELCRPARYEVDGQDGQGASRLQRHHHDRNISDRARARLGLSGKARQAKSAAGSIVHRSAEEARARRTRRHGRRQRLQSDSAQGGWPGGRGGLSRRGHAARRRSERDLQIRAQPECRAAVPELAAFVGSPAASRRFRPSAFRHPQVREKPGARKLNDIKTWKDDPTGVEKASEEIKTRYAQLFKV